MNEDNPIYINTETLERLEERYGWNQKYERLKNEEVVQIEGKYYKLSPFAGASPIK